VNGIIKQTCGVLGWLLLAACAGGCVQATPRGNEAGMLNLSGLLEPAPVRADMPESDQLASGPILDGECHLDSVVEAGAACPIACDEPPRSPFVGVRVLLSRLFLPLRCIGSGRCGRAGRCERGGGQASNGDEYHHSRFHPIPTRPVFDPREPPYLAMDAQMAPHGSLESGPEAPVPNDSVPDDPVPNNSVPDQRPTKAALPEAYPSSDSYSPPTRLEVIPTPPSTGSSASGDRTVLSVPLSQPKRSSASPSSSWVFNPPVLRDPEPKPTAAQVRRSVRLEPKSDRVTR